MKKSPAPTKVSKLSLLQLFCTLRARFAALAFCSCFVVSPATAAVFTIQDGIPGATGTSVAVPVTFSDFSEGTGMQFSVSWDQSILSYQSHSWNGTLLGENIVVGSNVQSDRIGLTYTRPSQFGSVQSTVLLTINFNALDVGTSPLNFVDSPTARGLSPAASTATWDPGSVEVVPEPVNVALGIFAGLGLMITWVRRRVVARQL